MPRSRRQRGRERGYSFGMRKSGLLVAAVGVFCCVGFAQKPAATGMVTGHVTCADTNTPARLAVVVLRPVPAAKTAHSAGPGKAVEARRVQTLLDGTFSIPNVAPGTYLVLASMAGYISPLAALGISDQDLLEPADELRKRIMERLPTVTVDGNGSASINISLERSAAVSGTIVYDDGSPAPGVEVKLRERKEGKWVPVHNVAGDGMGSGNSVTDDRGNFRITGLPALKEAIVETDLSIQNSILSFSNGGFATFGGSSFKLAFYSGSALRLGDAKPFQLTMGEERPGEDISIPLSKLHRVEGVLLSKRDGHVLNEGSVSLLFSDDRTELGGTVIGGGNENFEFPFVPEGDYVLKVNSAEDARFEEIPNSPGSVPPSWTKTIMVHEYGTTEMPLHVDGERTGVTVDVPEKASSARNVGASNVEPQ
jgi:hypothetical protein